MNFQFKVKYDEGINGKVNANENKENLNHQKINDKSIFLVDKHQSKKEKSNAKVTQIFLAKDNKGKEESKLNKGKSHFDISKYLNGCPFEGTKIPLEYIDEISTELKCFSVNNNDPCYYDFILSQIDLNPQMRSTLIDWLQSLHCFLKFQEETFFLCVNIIDRFLSKKYVKREQLQLLGITSLFISAKYEEIYFPNVTFFSQSTEYTYTSQEILEYEYLILTTLDYSLGQSLPIEVYNILCLNLNMTKVEYFFGLFLLELFMLDINYTKYSSLILAQSSVYLSLKKYQRKELSVLLESEEASRILLCSEDVIAWAYNMTNKQYKAVLMKFLQDNFMKISEMYLEKENGKSN